MIFFFYSRTLSQPYTHVIEVSKVQTSF